MKKIVNPMEIAHEEALKAIKKKEVPIGAVIMQKGKIISRAHNRRERSQNALMHAEVIAINKACKKLKSWRLDECELYVTLEPCPMCAGACANARLKKVIYACAEKTSGDHLCEKILQSTRLNHNPILEQDKEFEEKCSLLLTKFFKEKRS